MAVAEVQLLDGTHEVQSSILSDEKPTLSLV
jgi:hypothetical protein